MVMFSKNSYFILHPNKRAGKLRKLLRAPTVEFCKSLMSLTDDLGFSTISSIVGPHVNINTKVMIRIEDLYIKKVDNTEFCVLDGAHTLREKIRESVECRLLSLNRYEGQKKFVNDHNLDEGSVLPDSDNLLIYFHGGGFIGLSAKICDIYLREWANSLKFPIFSIDYKLSPEAIFPYAVHECFYTYCVILERGKSVGWNGKKVIFFGDSAGGNLVFAVTQMAIKHNIRIPDGLICAYPSCDTSLSLSPSRCLVHIDPFLSTGFLSVARRAYFGISDEVYNNSENTMRKNKRSTVSECPNQPSPDFIKLLHLIDIEDEVIGYYPTHIKDDDQRVPDSPFNQFEMLEDDPCENPLASPTLTDPEVLKRFPPVRMIISDTDPFLDEGLMMCKKLASSNVNVKVDIVSDLPHGFLQFILASIEVKNISDMIVARMKELLFLS
ncbi:Hormone-sensitive lipase [Thelohanellus kitauei]|uniref:Hormone-sensitive lipase n=1 Tax=Thelohanellus kitauei TaxID=669202 RepID=A0A0C2JDD7_THEKT|nr:Hormone-sensitive lipase [Thelohanellus kitauei]